MLIFNKKDQLQDSWSHKLVTNNFPDSFLVSSHDKEDMKNLRDYIIDYFLQKQEVRDLLVPYEDGAAHSNLRSQTNIVETHSLEKGIFYQVRVPGFIFEQLDLKKYCLSPVEVKQIQDSLS